MEKVLDHGDGDMIELYLSDGIKTKNWYVLKLTQGRPRCSLPHPQLP